MSSEMPDFGQTYVHFASQVDPRILMNFKDRNSKCVFAISYAVNPLVVSSFCKVHQTLANNLTGDC